MNYPIHFLKLWFVLVVVMAACGIAINAIIDPYGLWDSPRIDGFNAHKPTAGTRSRIVKPAQVLRINPKTVILGNSRPEMGLDPENACWGSKNKPVYNLTQPGSGVAEQMILGAHSMKGTDVENIYLGVDFSDYLFARSGNMADATMPEVFGGSSRLLVKNYLKANPNRGFALFKDYVAASASLIALGDSLATILSQRQLYPQDLSRNGFNNAGAQYAVVHYEGQGVLFAQKKSEMVRRLPPNELSVGTLESPHSRSLYLLDQFLGQAVDKNIDVTLFINPLHADYLNIVNQQGYWSEFERWKTILAQLATSHDVVLWDFTDYDNFSTGTQRSEKAPHELLWFWEPSHYTARLGTKMVAAMAGGCESRANGPSIGTKITARNVAGHLSDIKSRQRRYNAGLGKKE